MGSQIVAFAHGENTTMANFKLLLTRGFFIILNSRLLAAEHHCQQQGQPLGQKGQQYLEMYKKVLFDCHLFLFKKKHHRSQFSLLLFISYLQCQ